VPLSIFRKNFPSQEIRKKKPFFVQPAVCKTYSAVPNNNYQQKNTSQQFILAGKRKNISIPVTSNGFFFQITEKKSVTKNTML
jgi:hypothetical protein